MVIDVKHFRVMPHGSDRQYAALESTRGTYRKNGHGLHVGRTKPVVKTKSSLGDACARLGDGQLPAWPSECSEVQEHHKICTIVPVSATTHTPERSPYGPRTVPVTVPNWENICQTQ